MDLAMVDGLDIAYEVIGDGEPWVITPGGRYAMDSPGVRELAEALAAGGKRVLLWDRPNVGSSSVAFAGPSESVIQADALAGLLRQLELAPAVIAGGSGGARVSLITAVRHRDVARGAALWWMSGGVYGLITVGAFYCAESIRAAWNGGMEAVVELADWQEALERNPGNRQRFLELDPQDFIATLERWLLAYCPCGDDLVPGLTRSDARAFDLPTLMFRSGASDMHHTRATSEEVAELLPNAKLVEPPWGDTEWVDRQAARADSGEGIFSRWPLLAPQLLDWAEEEIQ
jgi:pimeloyl-ACP methyl ester carboxylesterase